MFRLIPFGKICDLLVEKFKTLNNAVENFISLCCGDISGPGGLL